MDEAQGSSTSNTTCLNLTIREIISKTQNLSYKERSYNATKVHPLYG